MREDESIRAIKRKLEEINKIITSLDAAIRAPAFDILVPYYFESAQLPHATERAKPARPPRQTGKTPSDPEQFFGAFDHGKPDDNVHLAVAWLYSQYGVFPIETKELKEVADKVGLTIPARPDATMRVARREGKKLYRKKGKGYELTVHGEAYVKDTYKVKKGTQPRPAKEDE